MNDSDRNRVQELLNVVLPDIESKTEIGIERLLEIFTSNVSLPDMARKIWDSILNSEEAKNLSLLLLTVSLICLTSVATLIFSISYLFCTILTIVV